ncbi:unnamed protein product [Spirodela intermedia]|uniref:Beta-amylase n=1 Tax=Spirodela intermedia TaxID=51605 RepID=A0A7I8LHA2_SPIIN|nr:unnamed protein product [Spirodela intermedia]
MATLPPSSSIAGSSAVGRSRPDPPSLFLRSTAPLRLSVARPAVSARLYSSRPSSGANGSVGEPYPGGGEELQYGLPTPPRLAGGIPVFVTLPVDAVGLAGQMSRRKTMAASFMALAAAGVEGVVVEAWWGIVERDAPGAYNWAGYIDLVNLAQRFGLKVRMIMAFHQCGSGPGDPCWFPLPQWVLKEIEVNPDLQHSDRFGRRSKEYISLGCDVLPVLKGRTPIQAYSDFMRSFRDTFKGFLGIIITEVQIGMGPGGDLRYPSCPSEKLMQPRSGPELGEFQCYDKYMLASLNACAQGVGKSAWGNGGPLGAGNLFQNPEETSFFKSDGSWNTAYGEFFLEWYSGMLLKHGERLCIAADAIFWGFGMKVLAKIAGIHWHYSTNSHPSELTAGYYNTLIRDGYLPIAHMFSRYRMILCCACFDMRDAEVEQVNPDGSPEGVLRQLVRAARMCNLSLTGENSVTRLDDMSLQQVVRSSRFCRENLYGGHPLSFNFVRMNKNMFDSHNWTRFTRFVRQMSDARTFQARLDFGASEQLCLASASPSEDSGRALIFKRLLPCQLRLCSPCA